MKDQEVIEEVGFDGPVWFAVFCVAVSIAGLTQLGIKLWGG